MSRSPTCMSGKEGFLQADFPLLFGGSRFESVCVADYSSKNFISRYLASPRKDSTRVLGLYVSCTVGFSPIEHPGNKRTTHWYSYLVRADGYSLMPVKALFCLAEFLRFARTRRLPRRVQYFHHLHVQLRQNWVLDRLVVADTIDKV